jgi:hypothetical protein
MAVHNQQVHVVFAVLVVPREQDPVLRRSLHYGIIVVLAHIIGLIVPSAILG